MFLVINRRSQYVAPSMIMETAGGSLLLLKDLASHDEANTL